MAKLKKSLLFRLTMLYAVTFTVLSTLGFTVFYYRIHSVTIERMDDELYDEAHVYETLMAEVGFDAVREEIFNQSKLEDPEEEFYRIFNYNGKVLTSTDMSTWGNVDMHETISELKKSDTGYAAKTIVLSESDRKARILTAPISPSTLIQIGESFEETEEYLEIFRNLLFVLITILIVIAVFSGWLLAKRALMDMSEVTRAAEDITNGNYERRVRINGRFMEIERLGATFNVMLDRIQNLLQSMQQINDNIAHDLRSPLARIRGIAEMTIVKDKSIDDYKEMAISTIEECDTLIDMINTMLDITESEAGVTAAKVESFDLTTLMTEACELFGPVAEEKDIQLDLDLPDALPFVGDKKRMQRIVTNLLENAIKYTPKNGTVVVSAANDSGKLNIDFKDTGIGISENDLPNIFNRFYRCDHSRAQGGVGLGLSLVKTYTESMRGNIRVKSVPNKGSVFSLSFSV